MVVFLPNIDKIRTSERVKIALFTVVNSHEFSGDVEGKTLEEKACNLAAMPVESELVDWLFNAVAVLDILRETEKFKKPVDKESESD